MYQNKFFIFLKKPDNSRKNLGDACLDQVFLFYVLFYISNRVGFFQPNNFELMWRLAGGSEDANQVTKPHLAVVGTDKKESFLKITLLKDDQMFEGIVAAG